VIRMLVVAAALVAAALTPGVLPAPGWDLSPYCTTDSDCEARYGADEEE
jgi:hypothetical protein